MHQIRWCSVHHDDLYGPRELLRQRGFVFVGLPEHGCRWCILEQHTNIDIAATLGATSRNAPEQVDCGDSLVATEILRQRFALGITVHGERLAYIGAASCFSRRVAMPKRQTQRERDQARRPLRQTLPQQFGPCAANVDRCPCSLRVRCERAACVRSGSPKSSPQAVLRRP